MDIRDIQSCADFYQVNFLESFYLVSTYNGRSFMLMGEKENFPHLMGIDKNRYKSNGYRNPYYLYRDILSHNPVSHNIIPRNISTTSKMYNKVVNFQKSVNVFWKNKGPLAINYNTTLSNRKLNVDILVSDIKSGYMLGWTDNTAVPINAEIRLRKYCISSWIDESNGSILNKEKYLPSQDVELIRNVFSFDKKSDLIIQKEYTYKHHEKRELLLTLERNNANLLVNTMNTHHYVEIAKCDAIHCRINGIQY